MRLAALLAETPHDELDRLAAERLGRDENVTPSALCATLEGVLRSYSFVRQFVCDRFPPTFSIIEILLDSGDARAPLAELRGSAESRTRKLMQRVADGELVGRDDSLRLYRRVLVEARRNDLVLDASETAILGVLRRELSIRPVEHFLLEHHQDFHEFWHSDDAFERELRTLRSSGLLFQRGDDVILAEEVLPLARQVLGLEMPSANRGRALGILSGAELAESLGVLGLRTSGSRDERLERLFENYAQPSDAFRSLSLHSLRESCRRLGLATSGIKEELVDRLTACFLHGADLQPSEESAPPPPIDPEPRVLDATRFRALFAAFRGDDLTDILAGIESSRITGAKETKLALVIGSPFCEVTLLEKLSSRALEDTLARLHLRTTGSKRERVDRVVDYFLNIPEMLLGEPQPPTSVGPPGQSLAGGEDEGGG